MSVGPTFVDVTGDRRRERRNLGLELEDDRSLLAGLGFDVDSDADVLAIEANGVRERVHAPAAVLDVLERRALRHGDRNVVPDEDLVLLAGDDDEARLDQDFVDRLAIERVDDARVIDRDLHGAVLAGNLEDDSRIPGNTPEERTVADRRGPEAAARRQTDQTSDELVEGVAGKQRNVVAEGEGPVGWSPKLRDRDVDRDQLRRRVELLDQLTDQVVTPLARPHDEGAGRLVDCDRVVLPTEQRLRDRSAGRPQRHRHPRRP